jgi:hypothetical protein
MANTVFPNEGKPKLHEYMHGKTAVGANWTLRLFENDYTPVNGSLKSNFTKCTIGGYSDVTITPGSWGNASVAADVSTIAYAQQTFGPFTGSGTIYGWYIVDSTDTVVLAAAKFDAARSVVADDELKVTPSDTLKTAA